MNEHLQPVFEILLPELERARIQYWVYEGMGIAGVVGEFIRKNGDVDIFVREADFGNTESVLRGVCSRHSFKLTLKRGWRPKLEVTDKREVLSVVPAYLEDGLVKFRFKNGPGKFPCQILERTARNICGYSFFAPPDEYIKELFKRYLTLRPDVKNRQKTRDDAEAILTPDEFRELIGS